MYNSDKSSHQVGFDKISTHSSMWESTTASYVNIHILYTYTYKCTHTCTHKKKNHKSVSMSPFLTLFLGQLSLRYILLSIQLIFSNSSVICWNVFFPFPLQISYLSMTGCTMNFLSHTLSVLPSPKHCFQSVCSCFSL